MYDKIRKELHKACADLSPALKYRRLRDEHIFHIVEYILNNTIPELQILDLQNNFITEEGAHSLSQALSNASFLLQELYLTANKGIGDKGAAEILSSLTNNVNLKVIRLTNTGAGEQALIALSALLRNDSCCLASIDLDDNPLIGNKEIQILCEGLSNNATLEFIYLRGCSIGDLGGGYILEVMKENSSIKKIEIGTRNKMNEDLAKEIENVSMCERSDWNRMKKLNIEALEIPNEIRVDLNTLLPQYLNELESLMKQLKVNSIAASVPFETRKNKQSLEYLQSKLINAELKALDLSAHQFPKTIGNNLKDQLAYLQELKQGKQSTRKLNVMVVGEEGVGKTSLIREFLSDRRWVGDTFEGYDHNNRDDCYHAKKVHRYEITDGIDIHLYQPEGKDFIMNLYDFAGQEIYYSTHQFVLSSQAIYLLLFNASQSVNANRIAYWFHTLFTVAPACDVFLIGTHFDDPSSLSLLSSNLHELMSILNNIQFLSRNDKSIRLITPSNFNISVPSIYLQSLTKSNHHNRQLDINEFPIWPISIPSISNSQINILMSKNALCDSTSTMLSHLLSSIISYSEERHQKVVVPSSWLRYRSLLFPQLQTTHGDDSADVNPPILPVSLTPQSDNEIADNLKNNKGDENNNGSDDEERKKKDQQESCKQDLYSQASFQIGIMKEIEVAKYGKDLVGIDDVSGFIELLQYWGEIVYIRNRKQRDQSLIITKPTLLISLFKSFITAKKLSSAEALSWWNHLSKTKKKVKMFIRRQNNIDAPHLFTVSSLETKVRRLLSSLHVDLISEVTKKLVLPVLIDLRLAYPVIHQDLYLVPSMLRKPPSCTNIINLHKHPLLRGKFSRGSQIAIMKRVYEFVYLPSGMFNMLTVEVWRHFSFIPRYQPHILNEHLFWENGFILTDSATAAEGGKINYVRDEVCILQTKKVESRNDGIARSIVVVVSCPKSKVGNILPIIHQSVINIIHSLEFEGGKNQARIYCSAITSQFPPPSNPAKQLPTYEYDQCFQATITGSMAGSQPMMIRAPLLPPEGLLRYLIPEYYRFTTSEDGVTIDESRYEDEITESKKLGEGATGEVVLGYWHNHEVAIKKPLSTEIPAILHEIDLLRSLHHPNILRILDVYQHPFALITEYCKEGDLQHVMSAHEALHPILQCCIIRDISKALSYLHNHSPPIIHCDVRPPNVFIKSLKFDNSTRSSNFVCAVLGDVGFSRRADPSTRRAGAKSPQNDVSGLLRLIIHLSRKFLGVSLSLNDRDGGNDNNSGGDQLVRSGVGDDEKLKVVDELNDSVRKKFHEIEMIVISHDYVIDTIMIANMLSEFIDAYFDHLHSQIPQNFEENEAITKLLTLSPNFQNINDLMLHQFPPLLSQHARDSIISLSRDCIHFLHSEADNLNLTPPLHHNNIHNKDPEVNDDIEVMNEGEDKKDEENRKNCEYWRLVCRFVIPIFGYLIEERCFSDEMSLQLRELGFYHHPLGDFQNGLSFFHYACKGGDLQLAKQYPPSSSVNLPTNLPHKPAAIHLIIQSIRHHEDDNNNNVRSLNEDEDKERLSFLDYVYYQLGANINLQDDNGETALIKAAAKGKSKLVVQLLNYHGIDVHIMSNKGITAIVAAAKGRSSGHIHCIKALLQVGSEYFSSLSITSEEIDRIRSVARSLLADASSSYARCSRFTLAIFSWLNSE